MEIRNHHRLTTQIALIGSPSNAITVKLFVKAVRFTDIEPQETETRKW